MADLKTNLLGFTMNSPIIGASGTVGYGVEYEELADFSKIGGISGKGLTLHGQYGNKGERLWETPSGLINSIGLQNPGVQHFIDVELGEIRLHCLPFQRWPMQTIYQALCRIHNRSYHNRKCKCTYNLHRAE